MEKTPPLSVNLRKGHLILVCIMGILIPSVSVVGAWYNNKASNTEMIHQVEQKMADQNLKNEQRFAKQEDLKTIAESLTTITSTLVELKTDIKYLRNGKRK